MLAHVYSAALQGIEAKIVKIEADVQSRGLPSWNMVGLLETAVKEARDRVTSAIRNSGFQIPNRKTIINLSPADLKKAGSHYDLSIAVCLLMATGNCIPKRPFRFLIAGELSLTGKILPIRGALIMALAALKHKMDGVIISEANAWEAALTKGIPIIPVNTLAEVVDIFNSGEFSFFSEPETKRKYSEEHPMDFSEVLGQPFAKRGLEIAAAGNHNIALKGPPGTGKTMLAERLPTILPPLTHTEALDVAKIKSWHGLMTERKFFSYERPFRTPHHSTSYAGLVGGALGGIPRLGEISLAHNGVLFLDEAGEFHRDVIEVLRQPIESGIVRVVRAGASISYPSRFILILAYNPCKCGYMGHPKRACICTTNQLRQYRTKLSGPLLDRIDLHIEVGPPPHEAIIEVVNEEPSRKIRERVLAARRRQAARYKSHDKCNASLCAREITEFCKLEKSEKFLLREAAEGLNLSARSVHRVIKVARTIADLEGAEDIGPTHLSEALQFRPGLDEI